MSTRFLHTAALLALSTFSTLALADPPVNVGRVSLAQGQVSIDDEFGGPPNAALVNWPVTSHNQITTARGARTEFRIGSTAVRLDGDSSLEVEELDDNSVRLRLNYGSAFIRVRNQDVARGFELTTPQARVRMQQPGRVRIDAERRQDTTAVNVFDGVALVDNGGSAVAVPGGRRTEIIGYDMRSELAVHDPFDDWAMLRDRRDDNAVAARYVPLEMTGYEDLDQYGMWRDDAEYGPLWLPRAVPVGWAPYRDGRWTWIDPWGWTWVDNAPWGYAPFHYGRWVMVNHRWGWAPGRREAARPVWAPALVGWVGGSNWNLTFNSRGSHRPAPAQGWYPLSPRDSYTPSYRVSPEHMQQLNRYALRDRRDDRRDDERRREGLTVVPHEQFGHRGTVTVPGMPRAFVPPLALQQAQAVAPPAPQGFSHERPQNRDGRRDSRFERDGGQRGAGQAQQPQRVLTAPPGAAVPQQQFDPRMRDRDGRDQWQRRAGQQAVEQQRVLTAPPAVQPQAAPPQPVQRPDERRRDGRVSPDEQRRWQQGMPQPVNSAPGMGTPSSMPTQIAPVEDPSADRAGRRHNAEQAQQQQRQQQELQRQQQQQEAQRQQQQAEVQRQQQQHQQDAQRQQQDAQRQAQLQQQQQQAAQRQQQERQQQQLAAQRQEQDRQQHQQQEIQRQQQAQQQAQQQTQQQALLQQQQAQQQQRQQQQQQLQQQLQQQQQQREEKQQAAQAARQAAEQAKAAERKRREDERADQGRGKHDER